MIKSTKLFAVVLCLTCASSTVFYAQTLAQWNFDVNTAATVSSANGVVSAAAWSAGTLSYPAGRTGVSTDKSLSTTGFNSATINGNKYLQFTVAPNSNYAMGLNNISFYDQKSATGPTTWVLRSSLDNYTANLNTSTATNTPFNTNPNSIDLGIDFQNINATATFRLYAYGATSAAGTWRVDDLTIEGSLFDVSNPIVNASKSSISFQTILVGTPSVSSSFIAAGFGLASNLTIAAPNGYEISDSQSTGYTATLVFAPVNNIVTSKVIYVRLRSANTGNFNGNITLSSPNVANKTIAMSGNVINQPPKTNIATVRNQSAGTNVFSGGRVTVATEFSPSQIFIQDNSGGIAIFNSAKNIAAEYALQLGDSVEIFGFKSSFNGLDQITLLALSKINTPQYNPVPLVINASELAAHEGELVTIQNVSFPGTGGNYAANTNYAFGFLPVRVLSTNASNPIVGSGIQTATGSITGISGVYNANVQLYPRFTADFNPNGEAITDANFRDNTTLTVATWNLEWFGHPTLGPTDNAVQSNNIKTVLNTINADIYQVEEVSDSVAFKALVTTLNGYSCNCSSEYSYSNVPPVDPYGQRLCFVYKNSIFSNVTTMPLLTNFKNDTNLVANYPSFKSRFWASGRLPYSMTANVTINGQTRSLGFIALHARANTNSSPAQEIYDMRKYDVGKLKEYLDLNYPNLPFIMLGDFNDDLDETVAFVGTNKSTYDSYINDGASYNLFTLGLSKAGAKSTVGFNDVIDHIIGSNELTNAFVSARVGTPQTYISNYGTSTTDHFPIMAKFNLGSLTVPVELLSFSGQLIDKQTIRMDWATGSESNSAHFDVERSANGKDFGAIGRVKSAGNSNRKISYFFNDTTFPAKANVLYYRLKQTDINGVFKYSKTIAIYNAIDKNSPIKVYPNPAKSTISVDGLTDVKSINIYNLQGVLMAKSLVNNVDISAFSAGIYLLEVENTEGSLSRIKFAKE